MGPAFHIHLLFSSFFNKKRKTTKNKSLSTRGLCLYNIPFTFFYATSLLKRGLIKKNITINVVSVQPFFDIIFCSEYTFFK
jgi:hypothetical protein